MAVYPTAGASEGTWGAECSAYHAVSTDLATGKIKNEALQVASTAPIADAALANKKYVDDQITANAKALGDYSTPTPGSGYGSGNAVTALTDGFVVAYGSAGSDGNAALLGYVAGTLRVRTGGNDCRQGAGVTFPVKSGDAWYVQGSGNITSATIKWVPFS